MRMRSSDPCSAWAAAFRSFPCAVWRIRSWCGGLLATCKESVRANRFDPAKREYRTILKNKKTLPRVANHANVLQPALRVDE